MLSGKLDRRIVFQSKTETQNAAGEKAVTWSTDYTRWGAIMPMKGTENKEGDQMTDRSLIKIKIRYQTGINVEDRFYYSQVGSNVFYDIISINEIGRQDGLEIHGKETKRT